MSNSFKFHGYQRTAQTVLTRHSALLLLALNDEWKAEKGRHQFTGGFDPVKHFHKPDLLETLAATVGPIIKKVLKAEDVYAHLLFLSEHKIGATNSLVRNHPGAEKPGEPVFQLGKAGEELADIVERLGLRQFIEYDAKHWQAVWMWARLVEAGECSPMTWTPEDVESLTGLNRGQIRNVVKLLVDGFIAVNRLTGGTLDFPADTLIVSGTRSLPKYTIAADQRMSDMPEIDLDIEDEDDEVPVTDEETSPQVDAYAEASAEFSAHFKKGGVPLADTLVASLQTGGLFDLDPDDEATVLPDPQADYLARKKSREAAKAAWDRPLNQVTSTTEAHAHISDTEVQVLKAEALRKQMSIDTLITLIMKQGVLAIMKENAERKSWAAREAEIREAEKESLRLANLADQKKAEWEQLREDLSKRRAALRD